MQYTNGDSHFIEASSVARSIDAFNEQVRETGYVNGADEYVSKEMDYIEDVQRGDYSSDYKRIQIANAIERINAKIAHMKPSIDGRVYAPGEDATGMSMDVAPSGSDEYRDYYIREMAKRVNREEADGSADQYDPHEPSKRTQERCMRRRHRSSNRH